MDRLGIDKVACDRRIAGRRSLAEWAIGFPGPACIWYWRSAPVPPRSRSVAQTAQLAAIRAHPTGQGGDFYGTGRSPRRGHGYRPQARTSDLPRWRRAGRTIQQFTPKRVRTLNGGRYAIEKLPEYQAEKLIERFDPAAMSS